MRKSLIVIAALACVAGAAFAGNEPASKNIANGRRTPSRTLLKGRPARPHSLGTSPGLYLSNRPLASLSQALALGSALPALRAAAGEGAVLQYDAAHGH